MVTVIYALRCPIDDVVRYVGKTTNVEQRLRGHMYDARRNPNATSKNQWLIRLAAEGLRPTIEILEQVPDDIDWRDVERRWIAHFDSLYNRAHGGQGWRFAGWEMTDQHKAKISVSLRGRKKSAETRRRMSEARRRSETAGTRRKRTSLSEEHKRRIGAAHAGKKRGPLAEETKDKIRKAMTGRQHSEETKRRLSELATRQHARARGNN